MSLAVLRSSMEEGGGSPRATGLLVSVSAEQSSSLNFLQLFRGKISICTAFVVFFRCYMERHGKTSGSESTW